MLKKASLRLAINRKAILLLGLQVSYFFYSVKADTKLGLGIERNILPSVVTNVSEQYLYCLIDLRDSIIFARQFQVVAHSLSRINKY